MSPAPIKRADGPTFCWECMRSLQRSRQGGVQYSLVVDPDNNVHRVHVECASESIANGNTMPRKEKRA